MAVRLVGAAVTATDSIIVKRAPEFTIPEILTYTLGGPDADSFTIDRASAQISTKADVALDTETKDIYTVTVTATDPSGADRHGDGDHQGYQRGRSAGDHGRRPGHIGPSKS